ncbi:MAG: FAD-dependent thymidylate synthase [Thermoplasmatota archaeon]
MQEIRASEKAGEERSELAEAARPPRTIMPADLRVSLLAYTEHPYDIAIASARTCYSPGLRFVEEVTDGQRDRIGKSIFAAGHHTPFQHPTFVFGLENVSRQFVWSFLHSHPFYNSEQSSQRYNVLTEARVVVPPLAPEARAAFERTVLAAWDAYNEISRILVADYDRLMHALGRKKSQSEKAILKDVEKKAIEMARYVLPIAATTALYHTVSGIVLKRYARMVATGDCPTETAHVVRRMLEEVRKVDPDFLDRVGDPALPPEALPESATPAADPTFAARFDAQLDGPLGPRCASLVAYDPHAEELVAESVREVLGVSADAMPDSEALDLATNPARNPYLVDTLNSWVHSPIMRALNHANYTFRKRLSHTADSQDQRHRTVPASRPLLTRVHTRLPDYETPPVIAANPQALAIYDGIMRQMWDTKEALLAMGVPAEHALYILPNATRVRFTQTGSFLNLAHKWRLRTCFNAQEEIYRASVDEVTQVRQVHPRLAKHIGPPCLVRSDLVLDPAHPERGPCPEGPRWCGIDVWRNWPNVRRPF